MVDEDYHIYRRIIEGLLFLIMLSPFILVELGLWVIIVKAMFDLLEFDYPEYGHLMPFTLMWDGINITVVVSVAVLIGVFLILLFKYGSDNVKIYIFMLEIFGIAIAGYIIVWVTVVYWILKLFLLLSSKWLSLIIVIAVHLLLFMTVKTAARIRG